MTIEVGGSGGVEERRMFRKQEVQVMAESSTRTVKFLRMTRFAVGRKPVRQTPKSSLRKRMYSFPRATPTNYHKMACLKQQKFILSQFWRPKALNQGVGRVSSF